MSLRPSYDFLGLSPAAPAPEPLAEIDPETGAVYLQEGAKAEVKYVPFSPIEEYQVREGETEKLHEEFHAVLCNDWRGSGTVTANGIKIKDAQLVGPHNAKLGVKYWSADSALCARVADGPIKVYYTYNPARPEVVHIWDLSMRYLESLPVFVKPGVIDFAALAHEGKEKLRLISRFTDAMQSLHSDDSVREINQARHNAAEMARVAIEMELPTEAAPRARSKRTETALTRAGRDAEALVETHHHNRALVTEVEADLAEIHSHRRNAMELAEIDEDILDPLDAL